MKNRIRLNHDCDNFKDTVVYFKERAIQMIVDGFELISIEDHKKYAIAIFKKKNKIYHSIYIYKSSRGKNVYMKAIQKIDNPNIITSNDCNIVNFLKKNDIKYTIDLDHTESLEYKYIDSFYGSNVAKRSGVPFMNHIDEGLAILHLIGASDSAKKAYCLHPIYQPDELIPIYGTKDMRDINVFGINANVIVNAVEYRHTANNYLSTREINSLDDIILSPLKDVNDMLIADKIQNRKDFELYHEGTHPRSKELSQYFKNWLQRLNISEDQYQDFKKILI